MMMMILRAGDDAINIISFFFIILLARHVGIIILQYSFYSFSDMHTFSYKHRNDIYK